MKAKKENELITWAITAPFVAGMLYLVYLFFTWSESSLEYWLDKDVPLWAAAIFTFALNGFALLFNLVTELARL